MPSSITLKRLTNRTMDFTLETVSGYSIIVAVIYSLLRKSKMDSVYIPFLALIWVGFVNEFISDLSIKYFRTNAPNGNIYVLAEALFIMWQFKKWRLFNKPIVYIVLSGSFLLVWLCECFLFSSIYRFFTYYRIYYSFVVVLMSIQMVNELITTEQKSIIKNPAFLICVGFILYFTVKVLVEIFYIYGLMLSGSEFRRRIYKISVFVNIFSNLIFTLAVLWMPRKQKFIPQS
jgi:hypothetical protein